MSSLATLVGNPISKTDASFCDVGCLAPPGSYKRKPAEIVNLSELYPAFRRYADDLQRLSQLYDPILGVILLDATVVGQGTVVTRDGVLIRDSCRPILEQNRTPAGLEAVGSDLFCRALPGAPRQERLSLLLKAPWYRNYGHWLIDSAALLALTVEQIAGRDFQIVIGKQAEPSMQRIVAETLAILAPNIAVLEHDDADAITFAQLYYVTPVSVTPMFKSPAAIQALRNKLLPKELPRRRRLYITRQSGRARPLVNEPDVIDLCERRGFEIVRPEEQSLHDQARMFAEADIVVGVKGAALANLLFGTPGATAIVLAPNNWPDSFFWDLAAQLDINYVEILGKVVDGVAEPPASPFNVNLSLLGAALDRAGATTHARPRKRGGLFYRECLRLVHDTVQPRAYFEVGCDDGETLALAACPAIGIDVRFQSKISVSPSATALMLFQMPSDEFFKRYNPLLLLEHLIDFAFLDGHLIENMLRDFINTERYCDRDGVVVLHNCLPLDPYMATRDMNDSATRALSEYPNWWTGDVWKMLVILRRYRPDLSVQAFNASPTGSVIITSLHPGDSTLEREFDRIMAEFREPADEMALFHQTVSAFEVRETSDLARSIAERTTRGDR